MNQMEHSKVITELSINNWINKAINYISEPLYAQEGGRHIFDTIIYELN